VFAEEGRSQKKVVRSRRDRDVTVAKKLIVLAVVVLGVAAVWRKVQADRAELDLWTEATTTDE
jgi:hypothetical protein